MHWRRSFRTLDNWYLNAPHEGVALPLSYCGAPVSVGPGYTKPPLDRNLLTRCAGLRAAIWLETPGERSGATRAGLKRVTLGASADTSSAPATEGAPTRHGLLQGRVRSNVRDKWFSPF
jgi:hypothetical protein